MANYFNNQFFSGITKMQVVFLNVIGNRLKSSLKIMSQTFRRKSACFFEETAWREPLWDNDSKHTKNRKQNFSSSISQLCYRTET